MIRWWTGGSVGRRQLTPAGMERVAWKIISFHCDFSGRKLARINVSLCAVSLCNVSLCAVSLCNVSLCAVMLPNAASVSFHLVLRSDFIA